MANTPRAAPERRNSPAPWVLLGLALFLGPWAVLIVVILVRDLDFIVQTARALQYILIAAAALAIPAIGVGIVGLYHRWASPAARTDATTVSIARAAHPELPDGLSSFHYNLGRRDLVEAPAAPPPILVEAEPAAPALPVPAPGRSMLLHLREQGHICRSGNSLLVGYAADQPQYLDARHCGLVIIGGQTRKGKTTTAELLLSQAVLMNWHVFACDPYLHKPDGLLARSRPFSGRLARQSTTPEEIAETIRLVDKIGRRRLQGEPWREPVLLAIDEFSNLVIRRELPADVLDLLPAMAMAYAVAGVHILIVMHDASRSMIGEKYGATLRRAATHQIVHAMAPDAAEFLLPSSAAARQVATLPPGQALYWGEDSPMKISIPWLRGEDLAYAAEGVAERPYAPRPRPRPLPPVPAPAAAAASAPQPLAPTEPIAAAPPARPPVPPTVPLFSSVDEAIVEVLATEGGWHTADAIARAVGGNAGSLKNKLKKLADAGKVRRRGPRGGPHEFAALQPSSSSSPSRP